MPTKTQATCKYSGGYWDKETDKRITYTCRRPTVSGSEYCKFHDKDYWSTHKDDVREEFLNMVNKAVDEETKLVCLGFHLPLIPIDLISKEFRKPVYFNGAKFHEQANFTRSKFRQEADFSQSEFYQTADFIETAFHETADFFRARFHGEANFFGAKFHQGSHFHLAEFNERANFAAVEFHQTTGFVVTKFHQSIDFTAAVFLGATNFSGVEFHEKTDFIRATFHQMADFSYATFIIPLRKHHEDKEAGDLRAVSFRATRFGSPHDVKFDHTYLGRVSFINANVEKVNFRNVVWREMGGRYVIFDEEMLMLKAKSKQGQGNQKDDTIDRKIVIGPDVTVTNVASVYNALRDNYEYNLRYGEAGKFFISEMEVRRLITEVGKEVKETAREPRKLSDQAEPMSKGEEPVTAPSIQEEAKIPGTTEPSKTGTFIEFRYKYNNWFRRNLSITGFYKHLCLYGESYYRPMIWAVLIIIPSATYRLGVSYPMFYSFEWRKLLGTLTTVFGESLGAFFQMGGATGIDLLERILAIPILGALVLALRRRFERRFRH